MGLGHSMHALPPARVTARTDPNAHRAGEQTAWTSAHDARDRWLFFAFTGIGAGLLLPNLGDRALWQDEAETALVARGILETGLPLAWDGRLLATQAGGAELTDSLIWSWTPWAMHYLAAASMALFGESALGARLLFACLGSISLGITFLVARRMTGDRWVACAAALLLASSVQYLLLMRQCRYYAIVPIASLLAIWGYREVASRKGIAMLCAAVILLFHANYAVCLLFASGLFGHALLTVRDVDAWKRLLAAGAVSGCFTLPWLYASSLYERLGSDVARHESLGVGVVQVLFMINQFVVPWLIGVGLIGFGFAGKLRVRGAYTLLATMTLAALALLPLLLWANPRYIAHLFPLGAIAMACVARELQLWQPWLGSSVLALMLFTNLAVAPPLMVLPAWIARDYLPGDIATGLDALAQNSIKREWRGYLNELAHPFIGPNEAIIALLKEKADPDDIVYAPYGQLSIMFHTHLRHAGLLRDTARKRPGWDQLPGYLSDAADANWLVLRTTRMAGRSLSAVLERLRAEAERSGRSLVVHALPVRDQQWGNRPYLPYHSFTTSNPPASAQVVLVELRNP